MSRINTIFGSLRGQGRKALMPFVCGGHPSLDATRRVIPALERAGASIVEIGIPFSDPIADGPTIAAAMHEAIQAGVGPRDVLSAVRSVRATTSLGLVVMVSISIVQRMGASVFVREAAAAGIDGLIFPDAPLEESQSLGEVVRDAGLTMSLLVAPTTSKERAARIAQACSGFIYLLARVGITGDQAGPGNWSADVIDVEGIRSRVEMLRSVTDLPIACGFGIASTDQVRSVVHDAGADAAIVGSALVKRMARAVSQGKDATDEAEAFTRALALGLR